MRPLLVVAVEERIEARLLLQEVRRRAGLVASCLEREVHALVPPVLLGMPGANPFDRDAQPQPPDGELAQAVERMGEAKGTPLSVRMARGRPKSWKVRSKTAKAYGSRVVDSASHGSR